HNSWISLTRNVNRFRKSLEQGFHHMVWLISIQQFQVEVASRFVGECLKEFASQAETKCTRHILFLLGRTDSLEGQLIQTPPDQVRSTAEINDTPSQTFIHGHVGLAGKGVTRVESCPVPPDSLFIPQSVPKSLPQSEATVLYRVMCVHSQIASA